MRDDKTNDILEEIHNYCIDLANRTLFLHGNISSDEDNGVEFRMSNRFLKNILILDKTEEPIVIHQQNIGGEWQSGMMIYDAIANARSHVSLVCHGEAISSGTIVLQAADIRYSMPNCHFMFHYGFSGIGDGEYLSAHSLAEMEKIQTRNMLNIYANRCKDGEFFKGKSHNQIKKYLDTKFKAKGDWHLEADKAKYYGFIDKIIGVDCELKDL